MKRVCNILSAVLFTAFLFVFAVLFPLLPDEAFSEDENRVLAQFPEFTWGRLADGSFSSEINDYFADQFPARNFLVGIKGVTETLMLRGENNGVLLGRDGQLAVRRFKVYQGRLVQTDDMDYYYVNTVKRNVDAINNYAANNGMKTVTVLPPRTVDVCADAFSYPGEITESLHEAFSGISAEEAGYIDLFPLFREKYAAGEYIYYRTDHHWTALGAYYAYCEIMKAFGMEADILPWESFSLEEVPDFYGTTWSRAGYKFVGPDTLTIPTTGRESELLSTCYSIQAVKGEDGKQKRGLASYKSFDGWLVRDYLTEKDKYGAFLDGTHNGMTVFKKDGERERLLVIKDSFANSLVPYLSAHFDLVIVNLAGGEKDAKRYAEEFGTTRALIVYNWENMITNINPTGLE